MTSFWKHVTQRMSIALSAVLLIVLLAACGGGSSGSTNPTPTPRAPTATPTPTTPSVAMQTYTGNGFSVSYPQTWKETSTNSQGTSQTVISDAVTSNAFTIVAAPDPMGASSAKTFADVTVQTLLKTSVKNGQLVSGPTSVTINGVTWEQREVTGTVTENGLSAPATIMLLVTTHPASSANTQAYELLYGGPTAIFSQSNTLAFQPMLQSFKFTS